MFRVQNLDARQLAADRPVKVGGGIMRVDHINLFSAHEARNPPEEPPIYTRLFVERDDARRLAAPGPRLFQAANDEPEFLGGIPDKVQDDTFQSAHAQTEYNLHDDFRRLHEGHTSFDEFHFAHGKYRHAQQEPTVFETADVGGAIGSREIMDGHLDDLQI